VTSPEERPEIPEYRLTLDVDFVARTWTGSVSLEPPEGTRALTLDADALEIRSVTIGGRPAPYHYEPAKRTLQLPAVVPGTLTIEFAGRVDEQALMGLYRSRQGAGYLLTTQCEPNGTQRIFPCLDRPDRKSRIALTVRTDADVEVVSNMLEESTGEADGRRVWRFPPTPKMPPYLFFLAIGRFDRVEDTSDRVRFRVFAPPGQGPSARFALESARRILKSYEEYYGIPYPLPKLDLVAVAEASFGAMENWGAIAFRDDRVLVDDETSSFVQREVFETIAHEIAHMWFGNLVTLTDWTDIWLNESLASFLETKISDRVDPSLGARTDFFLRTAGTFAAFEGDSLDATHPVRAHVEGPEEVAQIFDEISYGKGSSILAMIESYLGEEPFRRGIADYLGRFQYANATTADLWTSLSRITGERVGPLIDPWLDRPGVPSITARSTDAGIELTQRRFSYHGATDSPPWPIPMAVSINGRVDRFRFDTPTHTLPVPPGATVHLNPGAVGFYRVLYDRPMFDRLLAALPDRPAEDRWTFLADLWAYLLAGEVHWPTFSRAVRTLGLTNDRLVAELLSRTLGPLAIFFPDSGPVQDLARWFFGHQFARLGTVRRPGDSTSDGVLRERISFGWVRIDPGFARQLSELFVTWDHVQPDVRPAVAVARARTEGVAGYRELARAIRADLPEAERLPLEIALGWTTDPALVRETLDRACSGAVNRGIVPEVIRNVAANPAGRPVLWPWLVEELPKLDALFRGAGLLSRTLEITLPVLGIGRGDAVRAYFASHAYPEAVRGISKGLERLSVLERMAPVFAALRD